MRPRKSKSPAPPPGAIDLLKTAAEDLISVMQQVKNKAHGDLELDELLELLDGLGKSSTRLATLLKTEQQMAEAPDLMKELLEATEGLFLPDPPGTPYKVPQLRKPKSGT